MEPIKREPSDRNTVSDLPESIPSSEISFGPFVMPEVEYDRNSGCAAESEESCPQMHFLPPDEGKCAAQMLNIEIMAHAHTDMALQMATIKASNLERHYTHQSIALAAWQHYYQVSVAKMQAQEEEIERLKEQIEALKQKNEALFKIQQCSRGSFRPASR
ncbi:hypothetical protein GTA08_BOTSDO01537 [Botryosphaeria dothidea]|uniref:Uncharacterized protein n=1 Tax=Botryosphaeria dothidea TaxID=55169 RepID=A0A8H4J5H2_9PEZI|nr:hypothetical protein GTA08_BOTSDO01537 [Botryosphaeria dothidea]